MAPLSENDADLRAGLSRLAGLVADSLGLPAVLDEVAASAMRAITGADGAGVTLLQAQHDRVDHDGADPGADQRVAALAASAAFVAEVDGIQYESVGEGPSITAVRERTAVRAGSLGGDQRWPRFGPRVGRLGVHSALALPLLLADRVVGAINLYAHAKDAFGEDAAELGQLFATPAAVAVHNARVLADALAETVQLQTALETRPVIDQAVGIIRARTGRSAEEAFARLRMLSQSEQRKLSEVAERVVEEAVRRARARRADRSGSGPGV
jgi:hypothetical protein